MSESNKLYVFFNSYNGKGKIMTIPGPYYTSWIEKCGGSQSSFGEEFLTRLLTCLSSSQAKRLSNLKPGSSLRLHKTGMSSDLSVKRLTDEEISYVEEHNALKEKISTIQEKIRLKCKEEYLELSVIGKLLRTVIKKLEKVGLY